MRCLHHCIATAVAVFAGQGRAGQGRAGHIRAHQGRAGWGRAGQGRTGQGCAGQRQETVLADLARMSEPEHDSVQMLIDNEQQMQ